MTERTDPSVEESQDQAVERRASGEFVRGVSRFRHAIGPGAAFPPEPGRYHLYVALNCPWCHRVTLARSVLGLDESITMDVVFPNRTDATDPAGENLWRFAPDEPSPLTGMPLPECTTETASGQGHRLIRDLYEAAGSDERSVPILYDKKNRRIVNNESAEIVRMLGRHAGALGSRFDAAERPDLYPAGDAWADLRQAIDAWNERIYVDINNGAYKAGFSSDQSTYEAAFTAYFATLADLERELASDDRPFLTGSQFTEADLRLFPTLYRHDPVYYVRMKLNGARVLDHPHLWRWLCRVHSLAGVADSGSLLHCRQGYFGRSWNRTIPMGPILPMTYPEAYRHPELAR